MNKVDSLISSMSTKTGNDYNRNPISWLDDLGKKINQIKTNKYNITDLPHPTYIMDDRSINHK